jgi:anti-sigma regulatory factor (Ser/Thr protein kinase)
VGTPEQVRQFLRHQAIEGDVPQGAVDDLLIAASEAVNNALCHTLTPTIRCTWLLDIDRVEVRIRDQGVFRREVSLDLDRWLDHLGTHLMTAMSDELTVRPGTLVRPGTCIRLVKYLAQSGNRRALPVPGRIGRRRGGRPPAPSKTTGAV